MNVIATVLPSHSALLGRVGMLDFIDCFSVDSALNPRQAAEIITDFPRWARSLIGIRNGLTKPFGLSSNGPSAEDKVGFSLSSLKMSVNLLRGLMITIWTLELQSCPIKDMFILRPGSIPIISQG